MKPESLSSATDSVSGTAGSSGQPLLSVKDLEVHFAIRRGALSRVLGRSSGVVRAVDGVSLDLHRGEVLGVVGESGSGKSTLGRALLGLVGATGGQIIYQGRDLTGLAESALRPLRRQLQMVFQDPHASLNPSMTIGTAIADALRIHGLAPGDRTAAVNAALERVGLSPPERFSGRYPAELSGGQKQRAVIARAISLGPQLLVADEPISMLDMSVRAKILGLLEELRRDLGLAFIYITHDLASARFFCDRVAIMYLGKVVEIGPAEEIFANPRHPYTQALLSAVPDPDPARKLPRTLPRGEVPDAAQPPAGCSFHPRCPQAFSRCGWEGRDLPAILDQRWSSIDQDTFAAEQEKLGELEAVQTEPGQALIRAEKGSAQDLLAVLEQVRADDPGEPFWTGVTAMRADSSGVELTLAQPEEPVLVPVAGSDAEVSCHLYPGS